MEIDSKYRVDNLTFNFEVIDALDFSDAPYLLLEKDKIGNRYLSYLVENNFNDELRAYIQISHQKLNTLVSKELSVKEAFSQPENEHILLNKLSLHDGTIIESSLIPYLQFNIDFIPEDYFIEYEIIEENIHDYQLVEQSVQTRKIVFDFYLQSQNLISNIKPFAIYKVFTPIVEIIKQLVGFDNRNADKFLAFSNLRHGSLGVTIELNIENDLFLEKEITAISILTDLLIANKKEDFISIVGRTKDTKYIKDYKSIIKAIIDNNADLHTAYVNPLNQELRKAYINKEKATNVKQIIDEAFDIIEDIEDLKGKFLEIDIQSQKPSFKIFTTDEEIIKGYFELGILEKLKQDLVNFGKTEYTFTIKTFYSPETVVKSEEIKRYLIDYKKVETSN